jgi:hypothetical protein
MTWYSDCFVDSCLHMPVGGANHTPRKVCLGNTDLAYLLLLDVSMSGNLMDSAVPWIVSHSPIRRALFYGQTA